MTTNRLQEVSFQFPKLRLIVYDVALPVCWWAGSINITITLYKDESADPACTASPRIALWSELSSYKQLSRFIHLRRRFTQPPVKGLSIPML